MEKDELRALLEAHNIPLHEWGRGEAKTLGHLLQEIKKKEAVIVERDGALLRSIAVVGLDVYYIDGKTTWKLKEDRQVFHDNRVRRRKLETSLGEKVTPPDDADLTASKALYEELEIREPLLPQRTFTKEEGPLPSGSFPGLQTFKVLYFYKIVLPISCYRPGGYIERQVDKQTYFVWERLPDQAPR